MPEPNIFHETVVAVNASAERAETSEKNAKESAEKAETTLVDMKETVGNLTETVEQAEKLDGNLDKKLEQGENIVANIKDKLDAPENPMVGKYLRVKAVNEDGVPELEWVDESSGVEDVQINGTSIVKDGVAEIPVAGYTSPTQIRRTGLVYVPQGYGISFQYNSPNLIISNPPTNLIDGRNNMWQADYYALTLRRIDYAIKAAMCDGKGAAWTAEEQAAARERMGIDEWELFADIAIEEKVQKISFTIENWKELFVLIDAKAVQDTVSTTILYPFTNMNFCDFYPGTGKDASIYVHMVKFDDYAFCEISFNNKSGNSGTPKSSIVKRAHNVLLFTKDYFESGTTAKVWIMR